MSVFPGVFAGPSELLLLDRAVTVFIRRWDSGIKKSPGFTLARRPTGCPRHYRRAPHTYNVIIHSNA